MCLLGFFNIIILWSPLIQLALKPACWSNTENSFTLCGNIFSTESISESCWLRVRTKTSQMCLALSLSNQSPARVKLQIIHPLTNIFDPNGSCSALKTVKVKVKFQTVLFCFTIFSSIFLAKKRLKKPSKKTQVVSAIGRCP